MDVSDTEAANILYRREINRVGDSPRTYKQPKDVTENTVLVERQTNFAGLDVVLYTKIASTIEPLTAEHLASLAIASVSIQTKVDPACQGRRWLCRRPQADLGCTGKEFPRADSGNMGRP